MKSYSTVAQSVEHMKRKLELSGSKTRGGEQVKLQNPPPKSVIDLTHLTDDCIPPTPRLRLTKSRPVVITGKKVPPRRPTVANKPVSAIDACANIDRRRALLDMWIYWWIDQCRIGVDGSHGHFFESLLPWYLTGQIWRSLTGYPKGQEPRAFPYPEYIKSVQPACYGVLIYKIDYEVWQWFVRGAKKDSIAWFPLNKEPMDFQSNEYLEITSISLNGNFSAWRKFDSTWPVEKLIK